MSTHFFTTIKNIARDFNRYTNNSRNPLIIICKAFHNPGMVFSVLYRFERYLLYESNPVLKIIGYILYPVYFFVTYYILSYHVEPVVLIGGGLFMHNREIVITNNTEIGNNFSIMGQTTIGTGFFYSGKIKIGNNVYVGAGAKIIASKDLFITDNVLIGANAVVVKNITEDGSIYGGVPAKLIKRKL